MNNIAWIVVIAAIFIIVVAVLGRSVVGAFSKKNTACRDCPSKCDACDKTDCALRKLKGKSNIDFPTTNPFRFSKKMPW